MNDEPKRKLRSHIFLSKAVVVPCEVMKCRDHFADHLTNYLYDRRMMDAVKLAKAIPEARKSRESIPLLEYTFTVHTQAFH